ncbi:MAG: hypothetical protein JG718_02690 [Candidatus Thiothrix moscowensis]|nr:hypothetical protein [Candidatus Thiothrix moscowensis]
MKNTNVFVFSSLLILGGCFGGSGGGNGLSVALSAENAATAAQLSMCRVPYDHIPLRSYPLFKARYILEAMLSAHGYPTERT